MSRNITKIEWTDITWNPITGCIPISAGCDNCYARSIARRFAKNTAHWHRGAECENGKYNILAVPHTYDGEKVVSPYPYGFSPTFHRYRLNEPLRWRKPSKIFVCSMSDAFHSLIPFEHVGEIFETIAKTPRHTYQFLTKRAERMRRFFKTLSGRQANVWAGATVENRDALRRLESLRKIENVAVRFVSFEPLLEDLGEIDFTGIDWAIVGGETGAGARPMKREWALKIKEQCETQGVPFFFKSGGEWNLERYDTKDIFGDRYKRLKRVELDGDVYLRIGGAKFNEYLGGSIYREFPKETSK